MLLPRQDRNSMRFWLMTSAYHIGGFMNLNIQVPVRDPDPGNWDKCPPTPGSVGAVGR